MSLTSTSALTYWLFPQSAATGSAAVSGTNSTCVSVDLLLDNDTSLRGSGLTDSRGFRVSPEQYCDKLSLDTWNPIRIPIGKLAGRKITRITVGYDQPGNTGGYRGFIDDIRITS